MKVIVYRYTGRNWGFLTIPSNSCEECNLTFQVVKQIEKELKRKDVVFEYRQWFNWLPIALLQGVYHPPAIVINGKTFIQGVSPVKGKLKKKIIEMLKHTNL